MMIMIIIMIVEMLWYGAASHYRGFFSDLSWSDDVHGSRITASCDRSLGRRVSWYARPTAFEVSGAAYKWSRDDWSHNRYTSIYMALCGARMQGKSVRAPSPNLSPNGQTHCPLTLSPLTSSSPNPHSSNPRLSFSSSFQLTTEISKSGAINAITIEVHFA